MVLVSALVFAFPRGAAWAADAAAMSRSYVAVIADVQPRMVKIFGAGGFRGLESYQSGFLISPDGYLLTAWSTVLDAGEATAILDDGRRFTAEIVGIDPRMEIAVLKIEATELPYFALRDAQRLSLGTRVLAFSNLYGVATGDEPNSVLHGVVSGVTELNARRGSYETPYHGDVYILDAMTNNAGAAGGALTDSQGRLAGVLGKELRDARTDRWLNYAIPIDQLRSGIEDILAGRSVRANDETVNRPEQSANLAALGLVLVPNVLPHTPPFIDQVRPGSPAATAGLLPDDLIVLVGNRTAASQAALAEVVAEIDAVDPVRLTVMRGAELLELEIEPR
jgi:serine protease Do